MMKQKIGDENKEIVSINDTKLKLHNKYWMKTDTGQFINGISSKIVQKLNANLLPFGLVLLDKS